jgi:hypothetical protein
LRGAQLGKRADPIGSSCIKIDAVLTNFAIVGGTREYVSGGGDSIVFWGGFSFIYRKCEDYR